MWRLFAFILIASLAITPLYWGAFILAIWYIFRFSGYELIVLAVLVDGYFGAFYNVPVITIVTTVLVFTIDFLKPTLLLYTGKDEVVS